LIRLDDPAAVRTFRSFRSDAVGNRLSSTDRRGIRTTFAWDWENRLLSTSRADIVFESNQYDGNGNRIVTTDARGHTTGFEYDERKLLKSVSTGARSDPPTGVET
jgi:YD repeat-containing protein